MSSSFGGYKPYADLEGPVKLLYGRVCRDSENCDRAVFRELSESFVRLDEDVGSGRSNLSLLGLTVNCINVPSGMVDPDCGLLRITRLETAMPTATATPTAVPTATPTPTPETVGQSLVLVAVGESGQRTLDAAKRGVVADVLTVSDGAVPDVEVGYRLKSSNDEGNEIYVGSSGDLDLTFGEIAGSFRGYKASQSRSTDKVCLGECAWMAKVATLRFLRVLSGSYIDIDEDFISGINAVPSSIAVYRRFAG